LERIPRGKFKLDYIGKSIRYTQKSSNNSYHFSNLAQCSLNKIFKKTEKGEEDNGKEGGDGDKIIKDAKRR